MRALILLHRWLGVAFCLLFAMWFASGIVMHFVPFPALSEADRIAGMAPIDLAGVQRGPAQAIAASKTGNVARVRLVQRSDGPVYLVSGPGTLIAIRAADLAIGAMRSAPLAAAVATDFALRRHVDAPNVRVADPAAYDQWTVSERFDPHRPLYRVALNDVFGTELYVSSATGGVVQETTRHERIWNYAGSVAHWIYPTVLRSHPAAWSRLVWPISLLALIGAATGTTIGTLRVHIEGWRFVSPYHGLQAWHHWLGLGCMVFVMTWIFSGWLSMDDGFLFSTDRPAAAEAALLAGAPAWDSLRADETQNVAAALREVEWFAFGGRIYRRERSGIDRQRLFLAGENDDRAFLRADEIDAAAHNLAPDCGVSSVIAADDDYAIGSTMPGAPVFRFMCGGTWFDVDGSNGALLEKLDPSRPCLSLALCRPSHARLSGVDGAAGVARDNDRVLVRMRILLQPDRRRHCVAKIAVLLSHGRMTVMR
jgi:hypothetical protein